MLSLQGRAPKAGYNLGASGDLRAPGPSEKKLSLFFYLFPPAWALACGSSMRLVLCSVTLSPLRGDLGASEASCHLCVLVSISRE